MTEKTRLPILHVHETEVVAWDRAGWRYVGPSERTDFCIITWEHDRDPVAPFKDDDEAYVSSAAASLEGAQR